MSARQLGLIENVAEAVHQVCSFLKTSFGPLGLDKLVLTETNQLLVTNSGHSVSPLFPISHPAAQQAIRTILATAQELCDGSSSMLLMLDAALTQFRKEVGRGHGGLGSTAQQHALSVVRALTALKSKALNGVLDSVLAMQAVQVDKSNMHDLHQTLHGIIHTAWAGKTGSAVSRHLETLLVDLIMDELTAVQTTSRVQILRDLAANPPIISVPGMAVSSSQLLDGLLLRASFSSVHMPGALQGCKFVVLACSLELEFVGVGEGAVHVSTQQQYQSLQNSKEQAVRQRLQLLASRGVSLIFCTERVSGLVDFVALELKVNIVPLVSKEDVGRICCMSHSSPITSNVGSALLQADVCEATECRQMALSSSCKVILLQTSRPAKTLVLCSPSDGLSAQYSALLRRALHLLATASSPSQKQPQQQEACWQGVFIVGGGGSFHASMASLLDQLIHEVSQGSLQHPLLHALSLQQSPAEVTSALKILYAMAKAIPQALAASAARQTCSQPAATAASSSGVATPKHLVEVLLAEHRSQNCCRIGLVATSHACVPGLAGDDGWMVLADPSHYGVLEPAALHSGLWHMTVGILHQVLRLEAVLPARQRSTSCSIGPKLQDAKLNKAASNPLVDDMESSSNEETSSEDSE